MGDSDDLASRLCAAINDMSDAITQAYNSVHRMVSFLEDDGVLHPLPMYEDESRQEALERYFRDFE